MSNSNKHIKEFLNNYLNEEQSPDYAVLITGCWGSGKTYFIRQYLGGDRKEIKDWLTDCVKYTVVYVSLFGLKNRDEIDKKIQEVFRPKLGLRKLFCHPNAVSLVGNLAVVAVGAKIGTAAIAAGAPAASVVLPAAIATGRAVGESLKFFSDDFLKKIRIDKKNYKKLVVVFDDVERADMPLPELLGYLNDYVEHLHVPCILLADKDRWEEAQKCQEDKSTLHHLSSTKEKVIGKEFQIQTTFDDVWNCWFNEEHHVLGNDAYNFLKDYRGIVANVFDASGVPNFRSLKHSLIDFQRFIKNISKENLEKRKCNELLVADFFVHQYAYYLGLLKPNKISDTMTQAIDDALERRQEKGKVQLQTNPLDENATAVAWNIVPCNQEPDEDEIFRNKFEDVEKFTSLHESSFVNEWLQIWKKWLLENNVDFKKVNDLIKTSIWYGREEEEYIRKMLEWSFLDDAEGNKALKIFNNCIERTKTLTSPSLIMDLFYRIYWYAKNNAFEFTAEEFEEKMISYVKSIQDKLDDERMDDWKERLPFLDTYKVYEEKNDQFLAFLCNILKNKTSERRDAAINAFCQRLLGNDYDGFNLACSQISMQYGESDVFCFSDVDVVKFCEVYKGVKRDRNRTLRKAIEKRYEDHNRLEKEKEFLERLLNEAKREFNEAERPLSPSVFSLHYLIRTINKILGVTNDAA
ncbi:hypothetical protein IKQ19_06770 [Candidatus Saccharibacteria bacterium]|nr:hypothetical protein [Candidatus Saccharibacteria bacterium]